MGNGQEAQHNIARQLAILEVIAQADGADPGTIAGRLREAFARRGVPPAPDIWLAMVSRDASVGTAYIVSREAMLEAERRIADSRPAGSPVSVPAMTGTAETQPAVRRIVIPSLLEDQSPRLQGYLATPTGDGPWPAVVMLHEAFAIDDVMLRQVARMAAAGYLVLMPDLFSAGGPRRCLSATFRALRSGRGRAFADIEAARRVLLDRSDCTGTVGVLGFCMGGGFALVSASRGFGAASVNYGAIPKDVAEVLEGACPVVASYGGKDRVLAGSVPRLEAALTARSITHDVKTYPGAGHCFLNDAPSGPALLQPVLKLVLGAGPDPEAAADAWQRIEEFFRAHLGPPRSAAQTAHD
ncbi:dienelactone hydrolase family protein [Paenarthrobacter sp. PH39-S1]|uniref:dienelactone hydrolase family protein n=1 Tax=Paenarthrobacter sp. PH39-S1 TaxID=3046204 RepID=UPI0032D9A45D